MGAAATTTYRYVDTSEGQLHLTTAGDGPVIVLMHWTPLSAQMYVHEIPRLAERGYRAIGIDLMGFGRSAKPGEIWPFEKHAQVVTEGLEDAGVSAFAILGAHFSAPVAVEMAVSSQTKVTALLLDGCAHLLPEDAGKAIGAKVAQTSGPGLHEDGSHRTFLWDQAVNAYSIFDPDFEVTEETLPLIYRFVMDYTSTGVPKDFGTFSPFDMVEKLGKVTVPSCVLTAETDPLRSAQQPTVDALVASDTQAIMLSGSHPLHRPARRGEYADAIATFLEASQ
ncbi:MAG: hypothetical protein RIF37_05715 [Rhodospirillaceae bacterium]